MDDVALLEALVPAVERLTSRHLAASPEWFPHALVPRGDAALPPEPPSAGARAALVVNTLTEDNLPAYVVALDRTFGAHPALRTWARRWAAEEERHGWVLHDYLAWSAGVDLTALERSRMALVAGDHGPDAASPAAALVYLALQERATRIAHRNTAAHLDDVGRAVLTRLAADENLHHLFYRDLVTAAFELDPTTTMLAIEGQVRRFRMPGTGIEGFAELSREIAAAGILSATIVHEQVVLPLLRSWGVATRQDLPAEAAASRDRCLGRLERAARVAAMADASVTSARPAGDAAPVAGS